MVIGMVGRMVGLMVQKMVCRNGILYGQKDGL